MMIPTNSPTTTEQEIPNQLDNPIIYSIPNVAAATSNDERWVPQPRARSSCLAVASSRVRTRKMPTSEQSRPTAATIIGANTACFCTVAPCEAKAAAPNAAVAKIEPQ